MSNFTTAPASTTSIQPNSRWNLAWAVMAGASYHLNYNWLIDVGYRHIEMGKAVGGPPTNPLTLKNVSGDEIRVGLRYILD
jgi:opacity protein-like surface antigen